MGGASKQPIVDDQKVDDFLALFGNDLMSAMRALQHRAHEKSHDKPKPRKEPTGKVLVSVKDLTKTYKVGKQKINALSGISLDIHEGEFVALTGSSGSGKSTLLQLMGGLDKPSTGTITIDGVDLTKMSDRKLSKFRGQMIGFVFQFFYLQPFLRLGNNIEVPGMFARIKRIDRKEKIEELASAVSLSDRISHLPKELSGGQMQRAAIARALFNNPKLILADEPTGNLDSKNSEAIISLFDEIREKFGTTIVIVTHDTAIARHADREVRLSDGAIV